MGSGKKLYRFSLETNHEIIDTHRNEDAYDNLKAPDHLLASYLLDSSVGRALHRRGHASNRPVKGPVIRATFFFNMPRNIVELQVETLCCAYYHVSDQLVSQQNTVLRNFTRIIGQSCVIKDGAFFHII